MLNINALAIIIPAHNEGKVLPKTIHSLLQVVPQENIYVVSDGSCDNTEQIARQYIKNILVLEHGVGKARATNRAIEYFRLTLRYKYIMPIDADTVVTHSFIQQALPILETDEKKEIACVVGKVNGRNYNWITTYRIWEYEIAQSIHKAAQAVEDAIIICPGCSTIFRSSIFTKTHIPADTLTEDMDFTFLIHRKKLGKIVYLGNAKVVTQDPATLTDYVEQLGRWYTGFWQCLIKHNIPWGGQMLDLEVGILALEGLFNGLLVIFFIFLIPITLKTNPKILAIPASIDLCLFLLPTMLYAGIKNKTWNILLHIPHFYLLRFLSSGIFLLSFAKVVLSYDLKMRWHKVVRY